MANLEEVRKAYGIHCHSDLSDACTNRNLSEGRGGRPPDKDCQEIAAIDTIKTAKAQCLPSIHVSYSPQSASALHPAISLDLIKLWG